MCIRDSWRSKKEGTLLAEHEIPFELSIKNGHSYGQGGRVLGPVVGAFGELSEDVKELANAVAEELAVEHCSFYRDKTSKAVKGFFLNQLCRSWGHTHTADGHGSFSTAAVWCRFPMPHAVGHAQTIGTANRIS